MVGSSSRLIAASYALHRLPTPRHSPCALSNLTTLILVFRGSPDLPAVRLVQQEPSLLRRAFRGRTLVSLAPDGPWPRLIRFSSCIRSCGYNYPLCRYSLFKEPDSAYCGLRIDDCGLKNQGPTPHASQSEIGNPKPALACPGEVRRPATDEQETVEQETAGERGTGPATPLGCRLPLPYSPVLLSPAHLLYAARGGVVEPKGFEPMTSWLQTRRSPG